MSLPFLPCLIENYCLSGNAGYRSPYRIEQVVSIARSDPTVDAGAVEVSTCYNFKGNFTLYRVKWRTRINGTGWSTVDENNSRE